MQFRFVLMGNLSNNLKFLRKQRKMTQADLAMALGIKRPVIGAYEEERAEPKLSLLMEMAKLFEIDVDDLIGRDLNKSMKTTAIFDKSKIPVVPVLAAAGYTTGFSDIGYIDTLPTVDLTTTDLVLTSDMRVFQISGDSMLPIPDGSYIICTKVENLRLLKEGKRHIVVTERDGIVFKRVYRIEDSLKLVSDNAVYSPYEVHLSEIAEIWRSVGFILNDEE